MIKKIYTFSDLFHVDFKVSEDEANFIGDFIEKEKQIKDKYTQKISEVKKTFLDQWTNGDMKKRQKIMEERDKELSIAHSYQDTFERREKEVIDLKLKYLELAKQLSLSQDLIMAMQNKQIASQKRMEIINERKASLTNSGFSKLAGYGKEKSTLTANFIDSIDDEKAGNMVEQPIPNAILFYGPTGCGKTTFAKALAEEANCNFKEVFAYGSQEENEEILLKTLYGTKDTKGLFEKANEDYKKDNKRTIILLDEADRYFGEDVSNNFIRNMKGIMETCSNKNNTTLFLTTNEPQKIPYELLSPHRTGIIVSLDPPDRENATAVMQHYFSKTKKDELDYEKINDRLFKREPDELYSNSQIENICEIATDEIKPYDKNLNTDMVLEAIDNYDESSDNPNALRLTKEYLDKYENDKQVIGSTYYED